MLNNSNRLIIIVIMNNSTHCYIIFYTVGGNAIELCLSGATGIRPVPDKRIPG